MVFENLEHSVEGGENGLKSKKLAVVYSLPAKNGVEIPVRALLPKTIGDTSKEEVVETVVRNVVKVKSIEAEGCGKINHLRLNQPRFWSSLFW